MLHLRSHISAHWRPPMPRPQDIAPTYDQAIEKIMRDESGPMSAQELAEKILAARPSNAKDPMKTARNKLREAIGRELVFLDPDTVLPLRSAWQGTRFRLQLEREEVNEGFFDVANALSYYLPKGFNLAKLRFVDVDGQAIEFQIKPVTKKVKGIFGDSELTAYYAYLPIWLRKQKFSHKDYLLFTILDWENGVLKLEHEPYGQRNEKLLGNRNRLLADMLYEMLENATGERIYIHDSLPTMYARLPEKDGYPPDHWMVIVVNDERMDTDGWAIFYRDEKESMLEMIMGETGGNTRRPPKKTISKEQKKKVYRFKAALKHHPKIWRMVEIQGEHTLSDLNTILVSVFEHDFDHLGGFWKLVPRKGTKRGAARYREVDLGSVDPFGEGDAADITIAELELSVGDKVKYVFDFGDWIEHVLTLEAIEPPQPDAEYPREATRNAPKYTDCVECQRKGKKNTAVFICLSCTKSPDDERLLCEKCAEKHEDHYVEKILY